MRQMVDGIGAHDSAEVIRVPIPTPQNCLLPPWARIASRLRPLPTGLALLISEQTFQEQARIRRHTLLREQRTYPFLDLSKRRRPQRKRLLKRRCLRPRPPNHGCPWIQTFPKEATVMLGQGWVADRVHLGWEQEKRKTSGAAQPLFPIRLVDVRSFR